MLYSNEKKSCIRLLCVWIFESQGEFGTLQEWYRARRSHAIHFPASILVRVSCEENATIIISLELLKSGGGSAPVQLAGTKRRSSKCYIIVLRRGFCRLKDYPYTWWVARHIPAAGTFLRMTGSSDACWCCSGLGKRSYWSSARQSAREMRVDTSK